VDEMSDSTSASSDEVRHALELVAKLERRVDELRARVHALEGRAGAATGAGAGGAGDAPPRSAPVDPEVLTVIGAAVAAYLGEEPRIRSIHLVRSGAWAQEGRATIQAWYSVSPPTPSVPTTPR
jgi:hypothetical protein